MLKWIGSHRPTKPIAAHGFNSHVEITTVADIAFV